MFESDLSSTSLTNQVCLAGGSSVNMRKGEGRGAKDGANPSLLLYADLRDLTGVDFIIIGSGMPINTGPSTF